MGPGGCLYAVTSRAHRMGGGSERNLRALSSAAGVQAFGRRSPVGEARRAAPRAQALPRHTIAVGRALSGEWVRRQGAGWLPERR
jgi:hypothetical protein